MKALAAGNLDFNEWMDLASRDPAAFEARRRAAVEEVIEHSPRGRREQLRRLQWRIDKVRERSQNPLAGCLSLYGMMWDSLLGDGGLAEVLNEFNGRSPAARTKVSAQILRLPRRRDRH